jgi:signal transduction histidine kinase
MTAPARRGWDASGFPWTAVLLPAAIVLTLALAWQAVDAARSHRVAAEKVLRDDAALAANEYLRRARYEVGYFAFYPALRIVTDMERAAGALPDPARLSASAPIAPLSFLRTLFRMDLESGRITTSPPASSELARWLDTNLARLVRERASPRGELVVSHALVGGEPRTFVYGLSPGAGRPFALGFEVDLAALRPSFQKAFTDQPLLPEPLHSAVPGNDAVFLELLDPWGRRLLVTPGRFEPAFSATRTVAGGKDVLDGLTVRASIGPVAAERLLAGGLPPSRLPQLAAVGALATGLLVAALLLSRRERALARLRGDFVAGVSHELRTPLAQIRLFAETLRLDRVRSPEERRRSIEIVDQEARRLTQLVENTLAFSRSERGTAEVSPREQDVVALVRETLEGFAPLAAAAGARVETDLPEWARAAVDGDALRQVLVNLLDNAVKYGPSGQQINVSLTREGGRLCISVDDEGPGVPPRDRERIFEKFVRLERDRQTHRAGTGIGLAVASELVMLHGGTIHTEAGSRGGARFVVALPAQPETP